jgi:L-alanine-DL-glutamate epimerase-like enolase superfamily enzyme
MKIVDVRCVILGKSPIVRVMTDVGIDGYSEIWSNQKFPVTIIEHFKQFIIGEDPTNVQRLMGKLRRRGGAKPWGTGVSAIEIALWDLAGKASGVPVHTLLGGKLRDRVRAYNGGVRPVPLRGFEPEHYADVVRGMKSAPEGFTLMKYHLAFHGPMSEELPGFFYSEPRTGPGQLSRGKVTQRGLEHVVECVAAMKEVLGSQIDLALDLGPGWMLPDAIQLARALEPFRPAWLEDMLTGASTPYVDVEGYRALSAATISPIHTGEHIYLRENFRELIATRAVSIIGPDPNDVGGIAELKWIAEFADLFGVMVAPHGIWDGVLGLAAHIQLGATLPDNYIGFEYPLASHDWWYDIVEGLPDRIVREGLIEVPSEPGMGVNLIPSLARLHLSDIDGTFFD